MKILYLPLDERPCNYRYPQAIASLQPRLHLVVPPMELLGRKKQPADGDRLWQWIQQEAPHCQIAILSLEMLVYGGLLPSRLHDSSVEELSDRLNRVCQLKTAHLNLDILASNLIMRTPSYNSSEEEPDYYADWGELIFQWGWLEDKHNRTGLTDAEQQQWEQTERDLNRECLEDYRSRRAKNLNINQQAIALVKSGVISFLSIPQDDCAEYGFTAIDRQQIFRSITALRLQQQVHVYPGADEVGCTLLARAYAQLAGVRRKLYPLLSSSQSQQIVPLYEDRPFGESLKSHIAAAGASVALIPQAADCILAANTAGRVVQESWQQSAKDLTYHSHRNLRWFAAQIQQLLAEGKPVAIADVAFANGGETELVELLDDTACWDSILAYAAWNTSGNTLGTTIATAVLGLEAGDRQAIAFNKIHHLLEDWAYQSIVRLDVGDRFLPAMGASAFNFKGKEQQIASETEARLQEVWQHTMRQSFQFWTIERLAIDFPWQRMFEIGLQLSIAASSGSNLCAGID
ncbi:DUF4127 family protein [Synechococcus sp. PCC 7336]|uniref:DUF4127 family protein n=1 Tax=Synechococcus sp. PCC 7336 TaxID=195250 RepID=UPI00035D381F|nr:DUF4127 family protein [Synechococcus sp. PCC 7336]